MLDGVPRAVLGKGGERQRNHLAHSSRSRSVNRNTAASPFAPRFSGSSEETGPWPASEATALCTQSSAGLGTPGHVRVQRACRRQLGSREKPWGRVAYAPGPLGLVGRAGLGVEAPRPLPAVPGGLPRPAFLPARRCGIREGLPPPTGVCGAFLGPPGRTRVPCAHSSKERLGALLAASSLDMA